MNALLIIAIILILLALLGFTGIWTRGRGFAWWILALAVVAIVVSFVV